MVASFSPILAGLQWTSLGMFLASDINLTLNIYICIPSEPYAEVKFHFKSHEAHQKIVPNLVGVDMSCWGFRAEKCFRILQPKPNFGTPDPSFFIVLLRRSHTFQLKSISRLGSAEKGYLVVWLLATLFEECKSHCNHCESRSTMVIEHVQ